MVTSRGAFFLGLSLIICMAMFIYGPQMGNLRYLTIPTNQGVFILDTKTQMVNLCTARSCRVLPASEAVMVPQQSGYGYGPTYGQVSAAPMVNSLGVVENSVMPCSTCAVGNYVQPLIPPTLQQGQRTVVGQQPVVEQPYKSR